MKLNGTFKMANLVQAKSIVESVIKQFPNDKQLKIAYAKLDSFKKNCKSTNR